MRKLQKIVSFLVLLFAVQSIANGLYTTGFTKGKTASTSFAGNTPTHVFHFENTGNIWQDSMNNVTPTQYGAAGSLVSGGRFGSYGYRPTTSGITVGISPMPFVSMWNGGAWVQNMSAENWCMKFKVKTANWGTGIILNKSESNDGGSRGSAVYLYIDSSRIPQVFTQGPDWGNSGSNYTWSSSGTQIPDIADSNYHDIIFGISAGYFMIIIDGTSYMSVANSASVYPVWLLSSFSPILGYAGTPIGNPNNAGPYAWSGPVTNPADWTFDEIIVWTTSFPSLSDIYPQNLPYGP